MHGQVSARRFCFCLVCRGFILVLMFSMQTCPIHTENHKHARTNNLRRIPPRFKRNGADPATTLEQIPKNLGTMAMERNQGVLLVTPDNPPTALIKLVHMNSVSKYKGKPKNTNG